MARGYAIALEDGHTVYDPSWLTLDAVMASHHGMVTRAEGRLNRTSEILQRVVHIRELKHNLEVRLGGCVLGRSSA